MTDEGIEHAVSTLASEIIDKIAHDEEFRVAMKADPQLAMQAAGFADRVDSLIDEFESNEVEGFALTISPAFQLFSRDALAGGTIVASAFPSSGCCGASGSGQIGDFRSIRGDGF